MLEFYHFFHSTPRRQAGNFLSACDAPRRHNIFRAVDSPSCRGNRCDYEGKTYYDSSFSSLFLGFLNRLTALSKSLSNILISRSR